jgi:hypothetical protein
VRIFVAMLFLIAMPSGAQDLPDPGRRLSAQELNTDPDKPRDADKARATDGRSARRDRDAQACEGARRYYQLACRAPYSPQSHSLQCNEAYAMYRQNCP